MKKSTGYELAKKLGIAPSRGVVAVMKAQLITAILAAVKKDHVTHAELVERSGVSRSVMTGILSGSLQNVTLGQLLRLVDAVHLVPELRVKKSA